jgi:NitT/TauT family transport system permease protein
MERASFRTRLLDMTAFAVAILCIWQGLYLWAGDVAITPPIPTIAHVAHLLGSDSFRPHLEASITAFWYALVIAVMAGVAMGLLLGFHRFSGEVAEPVLTSFYSLPKVTLYPIMLLVFGLGISAKVAFGVIHGLIPVALFSMNAVRGINPTHLRTARVLRLSSLETLRTVVVPAIIPEIFTGIRVGFSLTLLGVLTGEMFASQRGIGFLMINAINLHDVKTIIALIFFLFIFATVANGLLLAIDRRLHANA